MGIFMDVAAHLTGVDIPGSYRDSRPKGEIRRAEQDYQAEDVESESEEVESARETYPTGNPAIDIPLWLISPPSRFFKPTPLYRDEV